ncbi:transcriptional activator spt7 [Tubulinosema ratisbonensis]|uniref:Transcriptional activator spt7 n=1 Tax=Tubulinosema ratisbonensis TaxID=291195 RepID=A0A437AIX5_9MICR|nr:transcriptional activator spt7 [Tubulinosema ratisbonensis]
MKSLNFTKRFLPNLQTKYTAHLYFNKILEELKNYTPFSEIFLFKVNKKEAPTYYDIIKEPMDLNTMTKKIPLYTLETFIYDLNLIWDNCCIFNYGVFFYINCANKMRLKSNSLIEYYFNKTLGSFKGVTLCTGENNFIFNSFLNLKNKIIFKNTSHNYVHKYFTKLISKELINKKIKKSKKSCLDLLSDVVIYLIIKDLKNKY